MRKIEAIEQQIITMVGKTEKHNTVKKKHLKNYNLAICAHQREQFQSKILVTISLDTKILLNC